MNITILGSSIIKPGESDYIQAMRLGELLAKAGHTVITGGYIGTMEAVSRGANEAGGHVVGVTCAQIERWRNNSANPWVKEERRFETLVERLYELTKACDAAIALPGGPGTLTEVALFWNLLIIHVLPAIPFVLVGESWRKVMQELREELGDYVKPPYWNLILYAATVEKAVQLITQMPS